MENDVYTIFLYSVISMHFVDDIFFYGFDVHLSYNTSFVLAYISCMFSKMRVIDIKSKKFYKQDVNNVLPNHKTLIDMQSSCNVITSASYVYSVRIQRRAARYYRTPNIYQVVF